MIHTIVALEKGAFFGWPANNGVWSWGDEVVVGFEKAIYQAKEKGHSFDTEGPHTTHQSRSSDGGETWSVEGPFDFTIEVNPPTALPAGGIDFSRPDLAIRCGGNRFHVSYDRCRTWNGPYLFTGIGMEKLTSRTDYHILGPKDCLFFLSAHDRSFGVQAGSYADRAFCARTVDGGRSFTVEGFMLPDPPEIRSVMPSTVRLANGNLVSVLRRRFDRIGGDPSMQRCWIDAVVSDDLGKTWEFTGEVSTAADPPPADQHNGNPPGMSLLPDGSLCVVYGYRSDPCGMRYRTSSDGGESWSPEQVLRDDGRTWDLGYPRTVVLPDGSILAMYYYTTKGIPEQHIAATRFVPK